MTTREASVLYDAPGPRTRLYTLIGSIVFSVLAIGALYQFVYVPLDQNGQFSADLWGPLLDPGHTDFPAVWQTIGRGFLNTMIAASMAVVASLVMGTGLAILRYRLAEINAAPTPAGSLTLGRMSLRVSQRLLNLISKLFVEFFRGLPVVLTIFFTAKILPEYGVGLTARYYLVIGLTLYNMVVIGEILRSGMVNLPRGQKEAADAVGLTGLQTVLSILLPQSYRIMLPALISQLVVVLKDTSLGFIISYEEALLSAGVIIQTLSNPIQAYTVVGIIYIAINYALSKLAQYVQRRVARGRKSPPGAKVPDVMVPGRAAGQAAGESTGAA